MATNGNLEKCSLCRLEWIEEKIRVWGLEAVSPSDSLDVRIMKSGGGGWGG